MATNINISCGFVNHESDYNKLETLINESLTRPIFKDVKEPLFTTNSSPNLFDIFLNRIPEYTRQHYNCNACRRFVNTYGGLVRIVDDGTTVPVLWDIVKIPDFFDNAVSAVRAHVAKARVTGVFFTSESRLGVDRAGGWSHLHADVPKSMIHSHRIITASQMTARKEEEYRMIQNAIFSYDIDTVKQAVELLRSDSLYRGEKFLGNAQWFLDILVTRQNMYGHFDNILWKKVATAPDGFCHIRGGMIGTLMDDIQAGYSFDTVKRRFDEKMHPLKYQRPQEAPSIGNVRRAEEIVAKLRITNSLKRRFASLDEVQTIWKPSRDPFTLGVFSDIKTKENLQMEYQNRYGGARTVTMTFEKFRRTVLPIAHKIEFCVGYGRDSYGALTTASCSFAPPIIKWDTDEHRNPFSWYLYSNGSQPKTWGLTSGTYVPVTGVVLQPNMWQEGYEYNGKGVFFILKGCKDHQNPSSALFPEVLRNDLREVRSTIEAYSEKHPLERHSCEDACGICLQASAKNWDYRFRVTTNTGVTYYKLDRWD